MSNSRNLGISNSQTARRLEIGSQNTYFGAELSTIPCTNHQSIQYLRIRTWVLSIRNIDHFRCKIFWSEFFFTKTLSVLETTSEKDCSKKVTNRSIFGTSDTFPLTLDSFIDRRQMKMLIVNPSTGPWRIEKDGRKTIKVIPLLNQI